MAGELNKVLAAEGWFGDFELLLAVLDNEFDAGLQDDQHGSHGEDESHAGVGLGGRAVEQGIKVSPGLASNVKYTSGLSAQKKRAIKKRAAGRKTGMKRTVMRRRPSAQTVDLSTLQAAAKFVATVGDAETATAAIKQVQSLQFD